jgi:hypothetical protein
MVDREKETPAKVILAVNMALKQAGIKAEFVSDNLNKDIFDMYTLQKDG